MPRYKIQITETTTLDVSFEAKNDKQARKLYEKLQSEDTDGITLDVLPEFEIDFVETAYSYRFPLN